MQSGAKGGGAGVVEIFVKSPPVNSAVYKNNKDNDNMLNKNKTRNSTRYVGFSGTFLQTVRERSKNVWLLAPGAHPAYYKMGAHPAS